MNISETMGSWKDEELEADLQGNVEDHNAVDSHFCVAVKTLSSGKTTTSP